MRQLEPTGSIIDRDGQSVAEPRVLPVGLRLLLILLSGIFGWGILFGIFYLLW